MHVDDNTDYLFMESWFKKWGDAIHVEDHSTGGYEHIWDIEAPLEAIDL